ncbi:unnamed protein product [Rhizoctonia solani]|uniref:Amidase domain-containing protein n=1 Tax=Rhizoctonia solani TaxID=456999 RepID=A0A8H3C1T0_9AGAM|nr:unnamed protein product [Rhizoctonia solani]
MATNEHTSLPSSLGLLASDNSPKPTRIDWQIAAARKSEDRANRLKPYSHWSLGELYPPPSHKNVISLVHARLTDRERSFLASDVTDLAQRLATKVCTAVEVTTAFCKATYAAQELTNCVTEVMFTQALARAQELDTHMSETGKVVGPLHGVPVSIKDHICVKGEDTATGFVAWAGRTVAEEDAAIVKILRMAGAVIYVKTANPQSLFAFETFTNIYGCTTNPYNRNLTPGGSSGGEGALIASRASLLGIGTDVGGSVHGFGCRGALLHGLMRPCEGMENIVGVLGPMTHSARDLELFFRVISSYQPWNTDFSALCMPWNSTLVQEENEKLVIGFFTDDGVVSIHPPIIDRLQKTREALVSAGHEVIDWIPMDHMEAFELVAKLYMLDGGEDIRAILAESGEPPIPQVASVLPDVKQGGGCTLAQSWAINTQRDRFRAKALKHWNNTALRSKCGRPVDVILCPAAPTLAPPHGETRWIGAQWNPENFNGAPIGLQLVGRRWQEEKLLAALKQVENAVAQFEKS